jgi:hypothetical protein
MSVGNRVGRCGACSHDGLVNVEEINIGPSEALKPVASVAALAGKGLRGLWLVDSGTTVALC